MPELPAVIAAGDLTIDLWGHRASLGGHDIPLTGKEFDLLCHFAEHPGWVWSRRQLLESVWGYDFGDLHVVSVHIANLRRKLGETASAPRFIHTVRDVGYRFEARTGHQPVSPVGISSADSKTGVLPLSDAFVGRLPELEVLHEALRAAGSGMGRLVTLGGDAGIGKTRLAEELAKEAAAQYTPVIWGLCREQGAGAWEPWPEIVRACLSLPGVDRTSATALQPLLERQGKGLAGGTDGAGADGGREQMIAGIASVLAGASRSQPLLVVLDDVHWADASSLLCLQHLATLAQSQRWLLVATYRDFEVARSRELRDVIAAAARSRGQTLLLRPLERQDVARLVARSQERGASPALVDAVHQTTGGNAFFVQELLLLLALRGGDLAVVSEFPRQEGVRRVVERRLGSLSSPCTRLLELAAVIGLRFSALLVERSSGLPWDRCSALLDEAEAARLVHGVGAGMLVFRHQLVRDVIYLGLSAGQRAALHRRVGDTLEALWSFELEAHAAELAHHFGNCGDSRHATKAFSYAMAAGRAAKSRYAWEEAAQWLQRALELREGYPGCSLEPPGLALLYEDLGDAHFESGQIDQAIRAYEEALRTDPGASVAESSLPAAARRCRKLGGALVLTPEVARAKSAYLEAERIMGEPTPCRPPDWWTEWLDVELERCWGHYYAAEFDGLRELAERIRPFVDAHGNSVHRGGFYNCLFINEAAMNRYVTGPQGMEYALASAEAYRSARDARERCLGLWVMSMARVWLPDHPDEARIAVHRYLQAAEGLGEVTDQLEALWLLAMWHRWHGHVGRVREVAERSLDLNHSRNISCYNPSAKGNLAWAAYRAGQLEQARALAREALETTERDEEHVFSFQWLLRWPLIGAGLALGDLDDAAAHARRVLRPDQQAMPERLETALAAFLAAPSAGTTESVQALAHEYGYL